jgi:hypothetical protein
MSEGGKKDAIVTSLNFSYRTWITLRKFLLIVLIIVHWMEDGAANVQKAGQILAAYYPRIVCTHGAEHVVQDIFDKSKVLNIFVKLS